MAGRAPIVTGEYITNKSDQVQLKRSWRVPAKIDTLKLIALDPAIIAKKGIRARRVGAYQKSMALKGKPERTFSPGSRRPKWHSFRNATTSKVMGPLRILQEMVTSFGPWKMAVEAPMYDPKSPAVTGSFKGECVGIQEKWSILDVF